MQSTIICDISRFSHWSQPRVEFSLRLVFHDRADLASSSECVQSFFHLWGSQGVHWPCPFPGVVDAAAAAQTWASSGISALAPQRLVPNSTSAWCRIIARSAERAMVLYSWSCFLQHLGCPWRSVHTQSQPCFLGLMGTQGPVVRLWARNPTPWPRTPEIRALLLLCNCKLPFNQCFNTIKAALAFLKSCGFVFFFFVHSGNQEFHTPLWLPNPHGNPFFSLLMLWVCNAASVSYWWETSVGLHRSSDKGCSIAPGTVTDITPQLLTRLVLVPIPCVLAAPPATHPAPDTAPHPAPSHWGGL